MTQPGQVTGRRQAEAKLTAEKITHKGRRVGENKGRHERKAEISHEIIQTRAVYKHYKLFGEKIVQRERVG